MVGMVCGMVRGDGQRWLRPRRVKSCHFQGQGGPSFFGLSPMADRGAKTNAVRVKNEKSSRVNFRMLKLHRQ